MQKLLIQTRAMNLLFHDFHNKCGKVAFFSDHSYFSDAYNAMDDAYDSVAERLIGLADITAVPFLPVLNAAHIKLQALPQDYRDNAAMFQIALQLEAEYRAIIEEYAKSGKYSQGTLNMVAQLADDSEVRTYKIKQRLQK